MAVLIHTGLPPRLITKIIRYLGLSKRGRTRVSIQLRKGKREGENEGEKQNRWRRLFHSAVQVNTKYQIDWTTSLSISGATTYITMKSRILSLVVKR